VSPQFPGGSLECMKREDLARTLARKTTESTAQAQDPIDDLAHRILCSLRRGPAGGAARRRRKTEAAVTRAEIEGLGVFPKAAAGYAAALRGSGAGGLHRPGWTKTSCSPGRTGPERTP
jgi:hypothetical protein